MSRESVPCSAGELSGNSNLPVTVVYVEDASVAGNYYKLTVVNGELTVTGPSTTVPF